ncbi:MAG TPA: rhamnulokinase family protein [Pyrinomonadaceae bacterium]|nr:rhamnulokinase family protein [Pyrinomonadaceae bacterium]
MSPPLYIAIDLGAGSGRVFLAGLDADTMRLEQVHRFQYPPIVSEGHLRWEVTRIFDQIKAGLRLAGARARELRRRINSIGVDSWGVDYGLIDAQGHLVELPVCYRDERTVGVMAQVFAHVSREEIFERTGIQFMPFNTLFQLFVHARQGVHQGARTLLLIPDLINFFLTGERVTEYTNATTTQMINARSRTWDCELLTRLNLPATLLPEIVPPGTTVGSLRKDIADELGINSATVVAPATHDTGSAIAGAPIVDGWAYISSGTWSLVGVEREDVLLSQEVARDNFTNEGGAFGTIRFLKNVMGLWILESCRKEWQADGAVVDYEALLNEVATIQHYPALIFPDDPRFFNPPSMIEAIAKQLAETAQKMPDNVGVIAKVILDSLAFRYASVLQRIEVLTNQKIKGVQIIGGGSQNNYLNQATANATGLPVSAGPTEATVIGNVLVQSIANGRFTSLTDARQYVTQNVRLQQFAPQVSAACEDAARRYATLEARYG